jgi:hypothetical protein
MLSAMPRQGPPSAPLSRINLTGFQNLSGLLEQEEMPFLKKYKHCFELRREKCFFAG